MKVSGHQCVWTSEGTYVSARFSQFPFFHRRMDEHTSAMPEFSGEHQEVNGCVNAFASKLFFSARQILCSINIGSLSFFINVFSSGLLLGFCI